MKPPPKIHILSDGNELTYREQITPVCTNTKHFVYKYTKSKTKKDQFLGLTEIELERLIKTNTP